MDWWVGAIAFVIAAFATTEILHALDVMGDPIAAIGAFIVQLWRWVF